MADRSDPRGPTEPVVIATGQQATTVTNAKGKTTVSQQATAITPVPSAALGDGLLVAIYAIPHLTDPDLLKVPFFFQCPPLDTFWRSYAYDYSTYQTLRHGEMASPQGVRLTVVSFATLFLAYQSDATFAVTPAPMDATRELIRILKTGTPFGLSASNHELWPAGKDALGSKYDVHMGPSSGNAAVLTSLDVEERAGEIDARYVNVSFQEYKDPRITRRRLGRGKNRTANRGRKVPTTVYIDQKGTARLEGGHEVVRDADLRKLAKHFYGEQAQWRTIQAVKANGLKGVQGSTDLGSVAKKRKDTSIKVRIPMLPVASINPPPGAVGADQTTTLRG